MTNQVDDRIQELKCIAKQIKEAFGLYIDTDDDEEVENALCTPESYEYILLISLKDKYGDIYDFENILKALERVKKLVKEEMDDFLKTFL